ncbi:unnamed protein product [Amoebophrya sp. A25]|nr:unnamed protein product [Amoebophrya sp. A25]|eukprot:GSA25T00015937001.1
MSLSSSSTVNKADDANSSARSCVAERRKCRFRLITAFSEDNGYGAIGDLCANSNAIYAARHGYGWEAHVKSHSEMMRVVGARGHPTWYKVALFLDWLGEDVAALSDGAVQLEDRMLAGEVLHEGNVDRDKMRALRFGEDHCHVPSENAGGGGSGQSLDEDQDGDEQVIEYLVWIDADAVIVNMEQTFEAVAEMGRYKDLIIAEDMHCGNLVNCGIILIRKSAWSRELWRGVWTVKTTRTRTTKIRVKEGEAVPFLENSPTGLDESSCSPSTSSTRLPSEVESLSCTADSTTSGAVKIQEVVEPEINNRSEVVRPEGDAPDYRAAEAPPVVIRELAQRNDRRSRKAAKAGAPYRVYLQTTKEWTYFDRPFYEQTALQKMLKKLNQFEAFFDGKSEKSKKGANIEDKWKGWHTFCSPSNWPADLAEIQKASAGRHQRQTASNTDTTSVGVKNVPVDLENKGHLPLQDYPSQMKETTSSTPPGPKFFPNVCVLPMHILNSNITDSAMETLYEGKQPKGTSFRFVNGTRNYHRRADFIFHAAGAGASSKVQLITEMLKSRVVL